MIIRIDRPFANDHPDQPGLLQMIIWMDGPLANDHPDGPASCIYVYMHICIYMDRHWQPGVGKEHHQEGDGGHDDEQCSLNT